MLKQILLILMLIELDLRGHFIAHFCRAAFWCVIKSWKCKLEITLVVTFWVTVRKGVFLLDEDLLDAVFAGSDSAYVTVFGDADEILRTLVTDSDSAATAMVLSVENVKRVLTDETCLDFSRSPNWSLTDF
jgi:hypothetical protein